MAPATSSGLLLFRRTGAELEVLLAHMGGPLWARRDERAWSIPKGEYDASESALDAARREFTEELGVAAPRGPYLELGAHRQSSRKTITIFAVEADLDPVIVRPGTFALEWPPKSGRLQEFPEIDRVEWFDLDTARVKIVAGQVAVLDRLVVEVDG
jgi:predicted NUDIX family NTP pyrophosphohydrolase